MKKKQLYISSIIILVLVVVVSEFASADFWACFSRGQTINFCNPKIPDRVSPADEYRLCMTSYDKNSKCYALGSWNKCNSAGGECSQGGPDGPGSGDTQAPEITITSPRNGSFYPTRKIDFVINLDEISKIEYQNAINGRNKWSSICSNCISGRVTLSVSEGENFYKIKATDKRGNFAYKDTIFFVDSAKPMVHKTEPKGKYANGNFSIQYTELSPKNITINYGNSFKGFRSKDLINCSGGKKQTCEVSVNLSNYEGQSIEYYFAIRDLAGSTINSKRIKLNVDSIAPVINYINYTIKNEKKVSFLISATEINLDKISYIDDLSTKPISKKLCSKLINGLCKADISLIPGLHNITIEFNDKAGNVARKSVMINI